jgi:hypothetical protein
VDDLNGVLFVHTSFDEKEAQLLIQKVFEIEPTQREPDAQFPFPKLDGRGRRFRRRHFATVFGDRRVE